MQRRFFKVNHGCLTDTWWYYNNMMALFQSKSSISIERYSGYRSIICPSPWWRWRPRSALGKLWALSQNQGTHRRWRVETLWGFGWQWMWQNRWYLNNITDECLNNLFFFFLIGDMPVCKTYIVIIISLLWVN